VIYAIHLRRGSRGVVDLVAQRDLTTGERVASGFSTILPLARMPFRRPGGTPGSPPSFGSSRLLKNKFREGQAPTFCTLHFWITHLVAPRSLLRRAFQQPSLPCWAPFRMWSSLVISSVLEKKFSCTTRFLLHFVRQGPGRITNRLETAESRNSGQPIA
jgi:hypothetical protein